jgi:hypothetical protein
MESMSNLYILHFPKVKAVKIGKADNVTTRINQLKGDWGNPDLDASSIYEIPSSQVFTLETILHKTLQGMRVDVGYGDGYTEMFSMDAYTSATSIADIFISSNIKPSPTKKRRKRSKKSQKYVPPLTIDTAYLIDRFSPDCDVLYIPDIVVTNFDTVRRIRGVIKLIISMGEFISHGTHRGFVNLRTDQYNVVNRLIEPFKDVRIRMLTTHGIEPETQKLEYSMHTGTIFRLEGDLLEAELDMSLYAGLLHEYKNVGELTLKPQVN